MKKTLSSLTIAALALFGAQAVMAQAASAPSRAEVKKQAADANKAGTITNNEAQLSKSAPISKQSDTTRAAVKQETGAANKAGAIPGTGVSNVPQEAAGDKSAKAKAATTDTTRADVKKETATANKAGTIPGASKSGEIPAKQ